MDTVIMILFLVLCSLIVVGVESKYRTKVKEYLEALECRIESREEKFVCCNECGIKFLKDKAKKVIKHRVGEIFSEGIPEYYCKLHAPKYDRCVYDYTFEMPPKGVHIDSNYDPKPNYIQRYYCSKDPWVEVNVNGKSIKTKRR